MADITNDELLAKVASETGVEPLAHTLGVKLASADAILDGLWQQQFFNDMAKAGHVVNTEEEAALMLKVAFDVERLQVEAEHAELAANNSEIKEASELLGTALGEEAAPVEYDAEMDDYAKHATATAELLADESVIAHMASLIDAHHILN